MVVVELIEVGDEEVAEKHGNRLRLTDAGFEAFPLGFRDTGVEPFAEYQGGWLLLEQGRRWFGDDDLVGACLGFVGEADGLRQEIFLHGVLD